MNQKLFAFALFSALLTGWLVLAHVSAIYAIEWASLKTVMLRIEGMT